MCYRRINLFTTNLQDCLHTDSFPYPLWKVYLVFNGFLGDNIHQSTEAHCFESRISLQPVNNLKYWRSLPAIAMCSFPSTTYGSVSPGTPVSSGQKNQNSRVLWVERNLKDHLVPNLYHGQGHPPLFQVAPSPFWPGLEHCRDGAATDSMANLCQWIPFSSVTRIKPGQLTSETDTAPQDPSAGVCCYNLLPGCREGNWGMDVWDQTPSSSGCERGLPSTRSPIHNTAPSITPITKILPEQLTQDVCGQGMI